LFLNDVGWRGFEYDGKEQGEAKDAFLLLAFFYESDIDPFTKKDNNGMILRFC
jgi:hypothetical protein